MRPTAKAGKAIAAELRQRGVEATFMPGQELNLSRPGVKVLTLKSAKGLEFPVVFIVSATIILAPVLHRMLHLFHCDERDP